MRSKLLEIIKNKRKHSSISQKEIAEKVGISPQAYSNLEKGKSEITLKRLDEILEVLGIQDEDIIQGELEIKQIRKEVLEEVINSIAKLKEEE